MTNTNKKEVSYFAKKTRTKKTKDFGSVQLGSPVEDIVTGYKGIATAKITYLTGCVQYQVQPKNGKDNAIKDCVWLDVCRLKATGAPIKLAEFPTTETTETNIRPEVKVDVRGFDTNSKLPKSSTQRRS